MKKLLLATAAIVIATCAQAQDENIKTKSIHVYPKTITKWHTAKPFRNVYVGDDGLLIVRPGATDHDLIITTDRPDGVRAESSDILLTDAEGNTVDKFHVEVVQYELPDNPTLILGWSDHKGNRRVDLYCGPLPCPTGGRPRKEGGMGDANSMTVTNYSDGSSAVSKTWSKP